jgi:pilus assembly protein CpaF
VLSSFVPYKERIVTIEDTTELRLHQEHVVPLESKPPNVEGTGAYTIRDLVKNALRMRPDRIVVGECRGAEALDMIQAMNTGHDGSMTTVHANSADQVLERLEVLILMAADLPVISIHRQIFSALDLIVHIDRLSGGRRVVTQISEVTAIDLENNRATVTDIFNFRDGVSLKPTGYLPTFVDELVDTGLLDLQFLYASDRRGGARLSAADEAAQRRLPGTTGPRLPAPGSAASGAAAQGAAEPAAGTKPADAPAEGSKLSSLINRYLE